MKLVIDFDGTLVHHSYPKIGDWVPGAKEALLEFQRLGAKLFLWTVRSNKQKSGLLALKAAQEFLEDAGIFMDGCIEDPETNDYFGGPKIDADIVIDDKNFGCPMIWQADGTGYVDWSRITPVIVAELKRRKKRGK